MVTRTNPTISQLSLIRSLDDETDYRPYASTFGDKVGGFDFAFGSGKKLDPSIASFEVL